VYECSSSNHIINYFYQYKFIFFQHLSALNDNKFNLGLVSKSTYFTYVLRFFLLIKLVYVETNLSCGKYWMKDIPFVSIICNHCISFILTFYFNFH